MLRHLVTEAHAARQARSGLPGRPPKRAVASPWTLLTACTPEVKRLTSALWMSRYMHLQGHPSHVAVGPINILH